MVSRQNFACIVRSARHVQTVQQETPWQFHCRHLNWEQTHPILAMSDLHGNSTEEDEVRGAYELIVIDWRTCPTEPLDMLLHLEMLLQLRQLHYAHHLHRAHRNWDQNPVWILFNPLNRSIIHTENSCARSLPKRSARVPRILSMRSEVLPTVVCGVISTSLRTYSVSLVSFRCAPSSVSQFPSFMIFPATSSSNWSMGSVETYGSDPPPPPHPFRKQDVPTAHGMCTTHINSAGTCWIIDPEPDFWMTPILCFTCRQWLNGWQQYLDHYDGIRHRRMRERLWRRRNVQWEQGGEYARGLPPGVDR